MVLSQSLVDYLWNNTCTDTYTIDVLRYHRHRYFHLRECLKMRMKGYTLGKRVKRLQKECKAQLQTRMEAAKYVKNVGLFTDQSVDLLSVYRCLKSLDLQIEAGVMKEEEAEKEVESAQNKLGQLSVGLLCSVAEDLSLIHI